MALSGNLEDLPIVDALQILGVSGKSGILRLRTADKQAELGLSRGSIVSASVKPRLHYIGDLLIDRGHINLHTLHEALRLQRQQEGTHKRIGAILMEMGAVSRVQIESAMRDYIQMIINEIATWVAGDFVFTLGDAEPVDDLRFLPDALVRSMVLNPQEMLLEAVRFYDQARESRKRTLTKYLSDEEEDGAAVDTAICEGPHPRRLRSAILITPNMYTRHALRKALDGAVVRLHAPLTPEDASAVMQHEDDTSRPLLLVDTDRTAQSSFPGAGGVEVVEQLRRQWPDVPTVSFGSVNDARVFARATAAGVLLHVPLPNDAVGADIEASQGFLDALGEVVARWVEEQDALERMPSDFQLEVKWFQQLYYQMVTLRRDSQSSTVALEMLRFIARRLERAILFLVTGEELHGLGAFGLPSSGPSAVKSPANMRLRLARDSAVQTALASQTLVVVTDVANDAILTQLYQTIAPPARSEALLVPLVVDEQSISLVYADNGRRTFGLRTTGALGVLVEHTALLLENVLLRRKLRHGGVEKP